MGRRLGDVRRTPGVEALTHGRQDLAQQVELLEDRLRGQAGVVEEKQLTLVVTDVVAERQRPLEHLLRAADGERGVGTELLKARSAAVDGGVVEVGTEFGHSVLGVPAHEELPAQADDRLVGASVAVVLEAAPVQLDHALGVVHGPEDVVVEEAVAVVGGLFGDLGRPDRAVPDEGGHVVERTRGRGEAVQGGAELALPVDHVLTPQAVQQGVVLEREPDPVPDVLAEPRVDRAGVAAPHHEVDASAGEVLQHREVLGDLHRVVRRDEGRRGRQDEALGPGRDEGERRGGRGAEEGRVVVLPESEHVEADVLGVLRDGDDVANALRLAGGASGRRVDGDVADAEDADLHECS